MPPLTTEGFVRAAAGLPFRLSLCNEVLRDRPFAEQCRVAAALGYDGLEIAPFTLVDDPRTVEAAAVDAWRRVAADHGLAITGLHWLLVSPAGLSVTDPDPAVRRETEAVIAALVDLCHGLGGEVLVHGSPAQRRLPADPVAAAEARALAREHFAAAGRRAAAAGVTYCIEPLAEADFVRTVGEAFALLDEIAAEDPAAPGRTPVGIPGRTPGLATMIDASAAGRAEAEPVAAVLDRGLADGRLAHVQINAVNRRAPGQGDERLLEMLSVLVRRGYDRILAVEPFDYVPDGAGSAAFSAGYVRGLAEALGGATAPGDPLRQPVRQSNN